MDVLCTSSYFCTKVCNKLTLSELQSVCQAINATSVFLVPREQIMQMCPIDRKRRPSLPPSLLPSLPPSFLPSVVGNGADVTGRRPFLAAAGESLVSDFFELRRAIRPPSFRATPLQSCVETFLLSSKNQPQNVPLLTLKMHYGVIFHPAIPETWQRCFYTTLYILHSLAKWFISSCGFG